MVPFIRGGDRSIVGWTAEAMREHGHEVEEIYVPFWDEPGELMAQMAGLRAMPLKGFDRVVTVRWPAHVVKHENKVCWFIHHYRALFDLWDSPYRNVPDDPAGRGLRECLRFADSRALGESRRVFSNSLIVRDRLREFNGVEATPLFPPLGGDISRFRSGEFGDYLLYPSRITTPKRQLLAVEALKYTDTPVRLVLMGRSENAPYSARIRAQIDAEGLGDRVSVSADWVPEEDKVNSLAGCLGVVYIPLDEDSYGYPSLEAALARKPIISAVDSGGALEFVVDSRSGLVCEPTPRALAAAFDRLWSDRDAARALGDGARRRLDELRISWDTVVGSLLGDV